MTAPMTDLSGPAKSEGTGNMKRLCNRARNVERISAMVSGF